MAIKVNAKDTDEQEKELEEWSLSMNLFSTEAKEVVKVESDEIKEDHTHRSTYLNENIIEEDDKK